MDSVRMMPTVAALAAPATAATLVKSYAISTGRGGTAIAAFDVALGTLESVEVLLSGSAFQALRLEAAPGSIVTGAVTASGQVATTLGLLQGTEGGDVGFTGSAVFAPVASADRAFTYAGQDASRFLSALRFDFNGPSAASTSFAPRDGDLRSQSTLAGCKTSGASATAQITYLFSTASAVPEPGA